MRALALTLSLAVVALPRATAGVPPSDPDFEPDVPVHSLALGPLPSGTAVLSVDVGWMRSGLRLDLGIASFVGLILSADSMLLYHGLGAETGVHAGVRLTPISEGAFRLSIDATAGQVFIPERVGTEVLTQLRGDLLAGTTIDPVTVYARIGIIGLRGGNIPGQPSFLTQGEFGAGVEAPWRKFVFGAEAFVWARSGHAGVGQWRLRGGVVF